MADSKITALTALTAADPVNDMFPVVDVSDTSMAASGTTKRISVNNLLSSSPTASGALTVTGLVTAGSATISGDLTVDTSTLKVDSTNDRVGIGTATPTHALDVTSSATTVIRSLASASNQAYVSVAGNGGVVGTSSFDLIQDGSSNAFVYNRANAYLAFGTNNTERVRIDSSGNVGVGVTPSAWQSGFKEVQVGPGSALGTNGSVDRTDVAANWYYNGGDKYINATGKGSIFSQSAGAFSWLQTNTASGGVGSAMTLTTAMTLDASGNLLVGATSALASGSVFQNLGINRQVLTLKGDTAVSYTSGIWNASTTADALFQYFATETSLTVRGGISYNRAGGLVAYNTTSDYRAKDIIGPVSNSGSLIDSLKVYVGKMKGATIERPMLIAHEAQEVAPYAVTGLKDEVDADGKDKYQQMDVSSFVPLLIAEIQSLRARVQTLEAR
jgi:hypothetical protein